jgi:uncharacterized protein
MSRLKRFSLLIVSALLVLGSCLPAFGQKDKDFPERPNPPRLVNDMAGMLSPHEVQQLETKLVNFDNTTSTQVAIVTITNIGDYDVSDYAVKLFNKWGIGQKDKDNGVLIFVSKENRKAWITTGKGVEGSLTDAATGRIYRNEIVPAFKEGNYYKGLSDAADAVIAVTKGEYKNEKKGGSERGKGGGVGIIIFIIIIVVIAIMRGGGNNNRGGRYMSGRGAGDFMTGWIIGSLLNGGRGSGGSSWGGGGSSWGGGGGFGGFGGGSSGGGGAGGSW